MNCFYLNTFYSILTFLHFYTITNFYSHSYHYYGYFCYCCFCHCHWHYYLFICNAFNIVSTPLNLGEGGRGWVVLENCQTGGRGGKHFRGVTGSREGGWCFQGGCSFSLVTFFNNLRNWRNESVNDWLCSVQIFIHYHKPIVLSH